ncbi:hypothetical protein L484_004801 [Morus notabilis]|uniref:BHLH domain-containing protein n=1 Tax=Morus notabilis TaxID=981085 RepID=W9RKA9_9ROSA|nr:hypothetical protein L484_004801 [Morus notabilis]
MGSFCWSSGVYNSGFQRTNDGVLVNSGMRYGPASALALASSSSLVLDSVRGELVEAPVKLERKMVSAEKSVEALKNHSEAEKRRRARINAHFDTLRGLIPGAKKMDKASLLAEVISHLKDLKRKAAEASEDSDCVIPKDIDEVKVEPDHKQALDALHLITKRAEIATLGCRMKNVFVMTTSKEENDEVCRFYARSVCQALRAVLEKFSASEEFLKSPHSNKRRRVSVFNP